jgi:Flp pilus assembly protein TadD
MKPKPTRSKLTASKLVNAGWTAIGEGQFGNARKSFIDAVGLEPRNAMAHYGLGYAADKQGDDEGALKYFCKAQALTGGAGEVAREVEGILARKSWECR